MTKKNGEIKMKKAKKGFTIVELVIVIAVIAILAGVLIPTFASVVKKANESKDIQLVRNLNTALKDDLDGHDTMYDALQAAKEFGYDVGKINTSATDNEILWDSKNDCFVYLKDEEIKYIPDSKTYNDVKDHEYWIISDTVSEKYSTYYTGPVTDVTVKTGFDAGEVTGVNVSVETSANIDLVIRANSVADTYTITAPDANIEFYGTAGEINVEAVKDESLHIYGTVEFLQVTAGRVVAEGSAVVKGIHIAAETADVEINANADVDVVTKEEGVGAVTVEGYAEVIEEVKAETAKAGAKLFASGNGSAALPFVIETVEQFMNIKDVNTSEVYVKLANDINLSEIDGSAYVTLSSVGQKVDVNLNGKSINGVQAYLFNKVSKLSLYDGKINFNGAGGVVNTVVNTLPAEVKFQDLVLGGSIETTSSHYGPLVSYAYLMNTHESIVVANDVESNVSIINQSTQTYTGGLFGYVQGEKVKLVVENCVVNGSIQARRVGGFAGGCSNPKLGIESENNKLGAYVVAVGSEFHKFTRNATKDQNANVEETTTADLKLIETSTALLDKNAAIGSEVVINHTDSNVKYYILSVEYWVAIPGQSGGYPRQITVTLTPEELGEINSGLYKNKFVQVTEAGNAQYEINGAQIWKDGDVYKVYDENYVLSNNSNNCINIMGYNGSDVAIVCQFVSYKNA